MNAAVRAGFLIATLLAAGACHGMGLSPGDVATTPPVQAQLVAEAASSGGSAAGIEAGVKPTLDGAEVYAGKCQFCHGPNMVTPGGGTFDLRKFPLDDRRRFETSILKGKNAMPAWQGILTPTEIDALWAYVQTRGR